MKPGYRHFTSSAGPCLGSQAKLSTLWNEAAARRRPSVSRLHSSFAVPTFTLIFTPTGTFFCFRSVFVRSTIGVISDIADLRAHHIHTEYTHTEFSKRRAKPIHELLHWWTRTLDLSLRPSAVFEKKIGRRNVTYCLYSDRKSTRLEQRKGPGGLGSSLRLGSS